MIKDYLNSAGVVIASALAGIAVYLLLTQNGILKPSCVVQNPVYLDSMMQEPTSLLVPEKRK